MTDNNKNPLTDNIFIFILPVIAYATTYWYEVRLAEIYGIPLELIEVGFTNMFLALTAVGGVLIVLAGTREVINPYWIKQHYKVKRVILLDLLMWVGLFLAHNILKDKFPYMNYIFIVFTLVIFARISLLFLNERYKNRIINKKDKPLEPSFYGELHDKYKFIPLLIFTVTAMYILTLLAANKAANIKTEYYTINKGAEVVLKMYSKKVITALFDRKTKTIKRAIRVRNINKFSQFILKKEKLGNLKLEVHI